MTGQTSRSRARNESIRQWSDRIEARNERHEVTPHFVYRAFDSYGLLLYIGCTLDVVKRMSQHRSQSQWHRYAETIAIAGPYDTKSEARRIEREAIDTEAAYFNAAQVDIQATQANRNAAARLVHERMGNPPEFDRSREHDDDYIERWCSVHQVWNDAKQKVSLELKATTRPFLNDEDRLARYLAAREDAELARLEAAA